MGSILMVLLRTIGICVCLHLVGSALSFLTMSFLYYRACRKLGEDYRASIGGIFLACLFTGWLFFVKYIVNRFKN